MQDFVRRWWRVFLLPALILLSSPIFAGAVPEEAGGTGQTGAEIAGQQLSAERGMPIRLIQGSGEMSPLEGEMVDGVVGVVTALMPGRGFYLQEIRDHASLGETWTDPSGQVWDIPSFDEASSALFCISLRPAEFGVGDVVSVSGRIVEEYAGGMESGGWSTTSLRVRDLQLLASPAPEEAAPVPVRLGQGGRPLPDGLIHPEGSRFFESLENMLVQVNEPKVVASVHTAYGEIAVSADRGSRLTGASSRGTAVIRPEDENPEVFFLDLIEFPAPLALRPDTLPVIGDYWDGPVTGVLYYSFGTYKILPTEELPPLVPGGLVRQEKPRFIGAQGEPLVRIASFNVENLSALSPAAKFRDLAGSFVNSLESPDIIALQEVQDNNGERGNDGTVSADETAALLIQAIAEAGGGDYGYIDIPPVNNADGGAPGANIRTGFLYRLQEVEPRGDAFRLGESGNAFAASRKPLLQWFRLEDGNEILLVNLHLNSKGGDSSPWGRNQPPNYASENQRLRQTGEILTELERIALERGLDGLEELPLLILGDMNEYYFRPALKAFSDAGLSNIALETLPPEEIYSYVYQHSGQALDHAYRSPGLSALYRTEAEYIHRYAEFLYGVRHSDHDPLLIYLHQTE